MPRWRRRLRWRHQRTRFYDFEWAGCARGGVRADDSALEQEVVKGELEHVELDALKGNQGVHNYNLPATVDLNQYQAVAIYCGSFHAIFGVARLEKF